MTIYVEDTAMLIAAQICTEKQMEVLKLRNEGYGHRRIGRLLMISPSAAKGRLDAADLRLQRAILADK